MILIASIAWYLKRHDLSPAYTRMYVSFSPALLPVWTSEQRHMASIA